MGRKKDKKTPSVVDGGKEKENRIGALNGAMTVYGSLFTQNGVLPFNGNGIDVGKP